jgi:hypothetical protein
MWPSTVEVKIRVQQLAEVVPRLVEVRFLLLVDWPIFIG